MRSGLRRSRGAGLSELDAAVRTLRDPATIRARCAAITAFVDAGRSAHFRLDRSKLDAVAERIAALTRSRFPELKIPYHGRWRHFEAGGVDRKAELDAKLAGRTQVAIARARIDLTLVSVLLDAGAGPDWRFHEAESGQALARSEGLGVASFRAFLAGRFSSDAGDPCRVDAAALLRLDAAALADIFQVRESNPLVGLEGRAALMRRLGEALRAQPQTFTAIGQPGHLFDVLTHHPHAPRLHHHHPQPAPLHHHVQAARILAALLDAFSAIWPSGQLFHDVPVGDVWPHPAAGGEGASAGWVPFHKLSQWLAYSLLEPFEWAGVKVEGLDALTGLPEYRNGGLLLDAGVIVPRDAAFAARPRLPSEPWVIEWRALTVALLDELAPMVRARLAAPELPLACMLEGGSWAAGRQIAAERRPGGAPPVAIESDGTVF
ncbi:MAG: URC4/urg3 family protein [Proteobacteria bacterium]|nr:URC4/urg3 family protein [Pseudomonadota bacterium]